MIRLQQLRLRMRHYCMHPSLTRARSIVSVVSQIVRFDRDFLQATKCFLQPQQKSCGQQLSSKVPSSVAILLEQQLNPPKLIRHFCVGSLAKYWSGGRRTCRTRSYGPDHPLFPGSGISYNWTDTVAGSST